MRRMEMDEANRRYSARDLVDLALGGHFCIREVIDQTIRNIDTARGAKGRELMYQLPDLRAYASEDEIDCWQRMLLELWDRVATSGKALEVDPKQMELF